MNAFTIKDLENLSGVKAHTIRIWEQRYDFLKPQRTGTNIRYYNNEELKTILNVALLNKFGFKISHINMMEVDEINQKIVSLTHGQAQQERTVNKLVHYMIELEIDEFEELLNTEISQKGIDCVINDIVFPFLKKIGILWITSKMQPGQEHLVTNIIRQKILVGIEQCTPGSDPGKTLLLFLPEDEFHELGLLYVYYLLKSKGKKVLYLGANVPVADIHSVAEVKMPEYIYTHITIADNFFNMERYLNKLHAKIPNIPIFISGPVTVKYKKQIPSNVHFIKSLAEVKNFISSN